MQTTQGSFLWGFFSGQRSTVRKVSDCRYMSDCRSRGCESDPGPESLTFAEIDHEIISTTILLPTTNSRRIVVSYKRKYVHIVLVNCLVKLAQEKSGLVNWLS